MLVVDDDEAIIELLRFLFEEDGLVVQAARNGREALRSLGSELPDLVILDLRLPGLSGLEILREIREDEKWQDLPVIILTVDSSPQTMLEGWKLGVYAYFVKPFDPDEVIHVARRVLSLPRSQPEASRTA
ncbi:MAG: response regulator [Armatimonadetes bacterium]|nr:response regulator [Armatimonadota bacterium]MDW8122349.1 response regulator [Armatimonadota bacterium]